MAPAIPEAVELGITVTNGAATGRGLGGPVVVTTRNGVLSSDRLSGPVEVRSANGQVNAQDIHVANGRDHTITAATTNGNVTVEHSRR